MRIRDEKAHKIKKCKACGKEFESYICQRRSYCCWDCYEKTGFVEARLGNASKLGQKDDLATRLRKAKAHSGERSIHWQGGITSKNAKIRNGIELRLWRESVYARDNWTCQDCGKRGSTELNAHHIRPFSEYPELRTSIDNGVTLCKKCHKLRHKKI